MKLFGVDVVLMRGGESSCEWLLLGTGSSRARRNFLEGVLEGTPRKRFLCEAETPGKVFLDELLTFSEGLLVRGGRKSCERAYSEKLFRDGKTSRMDGISTMEHDFLASTQDVV
jgi:hypothetical protein